MNDSAHFLNTGLLDFLPLFLTSQLDIKPLTCQLEDNYI